MRIDQVIQEKRKNLGLTQEQVAYYLGVSTPAVNKWEKGITCPDIGLLCPLARLLKIDVNTLLCFGEDLTEQEITEHMQKISEIVRQSGMDKGLKEAVAKIQEYPNCDQLVYHLALLMDGLLAMTEGTMEVEKYRSIIDSWYDRCVSSKEEKIRNGAIYMLASKYTNNHQFDEAQKYVDQLPEMDGLDKNVLEINILLGKKETNKAAELSERMVQKAVMNFQTYILKLLEAEIQAENIDVAKQIANIWHEVAEKLGIWKYSIYIADLQVALETKNVEDSIKILKTMLHAVREPISYKASPLDYRINEVYHRMSEGKKGVTGEAFLPGLIKELKNSHSYDFLRGIIGFEEILDEFTK